MVRRIDVGLASALAVAIVLFSVAYTTTMPGSGAGRDAPLDEFSAERAMTHVEAIATEPHPMGSIAISRVRQYLVDTAADLGLEVDVQMFRAPDRLGDGAMVDVGNVIAWIPGEANTKAVLLVAHYDTVAVTPGANDNSVPVAALLETARALRAGPAVNNDIVLLFTDGEEPSDRLFGSNAFVSLPGSTDSIGLVVNFESSGGTGASTLVETNGPQGWLVGELAAATSPTAFSLLTELTNLIGDIGTDFDVFSEAGLPGMHFAYLQNSPIYHTAADSIDNVGVGSLQGHGDTALAIARHFGNLDLTPAPPAGDLVFFNAGPVFVRYPETWGVTAALLAALGAGWLAVRHGWIRAVRAAGRALGTGLAGAIGGTLVWMGLASLRPSMAVPESYVYAIVAVGIATGLAILMRFGRLAPLERRLGLAVLGAALAILTAISVPGFSYLFVWPAWAIVACTSWRPSTSWEAVARFAVVALPTLLVLVPAFDYLMQFASPRPGNPGSEVLSAAVAPMLLALLAIGILTSKWHRTD